MLLLIQLQFLQHEVLLSSHGENHSSILRDPLKILINQELESLWSRICRVFEDLKGSLKVLSGLPKILTKILKHLQGSSKTPLKDLCKLSEDLGQSLQNYLQDLLTSG